MKRLTIVMAVLICVVLAEGAVARANGFTSSGKLESPLAMLSVLGKPLSKIRTVAGCVSGAGVEGCNSKEGPNLLSLPIPALITNLELNDMGKLFHTWAFASTSLFPNPRAAWCFVNPFRLGSPYFMGYLGLGSSGARLIKPEVAAAPRANYSGAPASDPESDATGRKAVTSDAPVTVQRSRDQGLDNPGSTTQNNEVEPATLAVMGLLLLGIAFAVRRTRRPGNEGIRE